VKETTFNPHLEALRGYAALMVLFHHLTYLPEICPGFSFYNEFLPYTFPGHLMVMVFFMLSGYVIGLSSQRAEKFDAISYLKKRALRIYPIYLVAILFTVVLFLPIWEEVLGSLLFLQNLVVANLHQNEPLWSLNHEVIYYLLAVPILVRRINPILVLALLALIILYSTFVCPLPAFILTYAVGFTFWMIGYAISFMKKEVEPSSNELASCFILLLGYEYINFFQAAFQHLPFWHSEGKYLQHLVSQYELVLLPICTYVMLVCTGKATRAKQVLYYALYFTSTFMLLYFVVVDKFFNRPLLFFPTFCLLLAWLASQQRFWNVSIGSWTRLGSISYALYVIHAPILHAIGRIEYFTGTLAFFWLRFLLCTMLAVILSYFLEKKFQPWVKGKLSAQIV